MDIISPYDPLFKKHAKIIGWDWQLLASISYQESHFNPTVVSWAGAEGAYGNHAKYGEGIRCHPA